MLTQAFYLKSKFVRICYFLNGALRSLNNAPTLLIILILVGEVTEWPKVQHWKCCVRVKPRTAGSNPALSAKKL